MSLESHVWGALGTAIVSIMGILFFKEDFGVVKGICLGMIISGVVGLNLSGNSSEIKEELPS